MSSVKIEDLSKEIAETLELYAGMTNEFIKDSANKATDEAVKFLRENSPKDRGKYAKGWRRDSMPKAKGYVAVVRNKEYRLTHLLEHGHARRGGGRKVPAQVHIKPAEEMAIQRFEDELIRRIESEE